MATTNEKINFFETLYDFQHGKEIDFDKILLNRTYGEIAILIDSVMLQIELLKAKNLDPVQYEIQKQYIKFFYGLLPCTTLEVVEQDMNIDNVDLDFENEIYTRSATVRKIYEMIDNIIHKQELGVINELTKELNHLPTPKEIEELQKDMGNIFNNKTQEELKTIENILAYNDPNMKMVKDILTTPEIPTQKAELGSIEN